MTFDYAGCMNNKKKPRQRIAKPRPYALKLKGAEICHWFGYGGRDLSPAAKAKATDSPRGKWTGRRI